VSMRHKYTARDAEVAVLYEHGRQNSLQGVWRAVLCEHSRQKSQCKSAESSIYEACRRKKSIQGVQRGSICVQLWQYSYWSVEQQSYVNIAG
jgi:hypothetical protein